MKLETCTEHVAACIHDALPPCAFSCPFGLDIRSLLRKTAKGRMPAAYRELRTALIFPSVVCALCPQPCRNACQRKDFGDEPLDMHRLEEAIIRLGGGQAPDKFPVPPKEAKIAVIGAGPAGLSLALNMAQKKYPVTVFEQSGQWGGFLKEHPQFARFDEEFSGQFSAEDVTFRFHTAVTDLDALSEFSAVCIATGEGGDTFGLLDGWDPQLFSTGRKGAFLVGGAAGMDCMSAIAAGPNLSRMMESAIQTGRVTDERKKQKPYHHSLIPKNAEHAPLVLPADPEAGYTKEEAKAEAARCFQCNCSRCLDQCELMNKYKKAPFQAAMEVAADSSPHFLASRTMTRQTYSCNQCSYCSGICPESVDMGELFRLSREARTEAGIQPAAFHDFWLREMDFAVHDGFLAAPPPGQETCRYAFFPGCQLTASLPEHTRKTAELLTRRLGAGVLLGCCGAPAWWAGEKKLREENDKRLTDAWERLGKPTLVLACASCLELFTRNLPHIPVVSLYQLLGQETELSFVSYAPCAVFDPCAARLDDEMRRGVRTLLKESGTTYSELPEPGRCCGYGGHIRAANPELYRTVTEHRAAESNLPYVVYCANCREVFLEQGKDCRHILELLFGPAGPVPHLSEKHRNALRVKGALMQAMLNETYTPPAHPWDGLVLDIPPEVRCEMEEHLITDDDVKECIFSAEQTGDGFLQEDGTHLAALVRRVITYWVAYRPGEGGGPIRVESVYSHRMRLGEEEDDHG